MRLYRCALIPALIFSAVCATSPASAQGVANGLRKGFPGLDGQFKVIDRVDDDYNCIAHTLGMHDRWIDPETGPANAPLAPMDQLYGTFGYQRTNALDLKNDPQLQRVAVYGRLAPNGAIKEVTHAALQEPDGSWTSKLGELPLIRHADPYAVDGPTYGVPVATYVRPARNQGMGRNRNPQAVNAPFAPLVDDAGRNANAMAGGVGDVGGPQGMGLRGQAAGNNGLRGGPMSGFANGMQGLRNKGNGNGALTTNSTSTANQGFLAGGLRQVGMQCLGGDNGAGQGASNFAGRGMNNGSPSSFAFAGAFANGSGAWASAGTTNSGASSGASTGQFCQGTRNTGDSLNSLLGNSRSTNNSGNFQKGIGGSAGDLISVKIRGDNDVVNINMGPGGTVGNRLRVDIKGNNDTVNINFGSAKSATNTATNSAAKNATNTAANTIGAAKNSVALNAPLAGNAKSTGNSLNSLLANNGSVKSAGNNTTPKNTGASNTAKIPGALVGNNLHVKVAGNNNSVTVNRSPGTLVGSKTHTTSTNTSVVKNGAGTAGNLVGNGSVAKNIANKAVSQSPLVKNAPGNLVGSKAAGKSAFAVDPKTIQGTATILHAATAKNTAGGLAKNVTAKNTSPVIAKNQVNQKSASNAMNVARSRTNVSTPSLVQRGPVTNMLHQAANQNRAPVMHVASAPRTAGNMSMRRK